MINLILKCGVAMVCALATMSMTAPPAAPTPTAPTVKTMRVPDGGIQPQVEVDSAGTVHLVYYKGDPRAGDLYYIKSTDAGETFSKPVRVNSQPGSALAIGSVRGSQLAIGKNHRVHVAWNGANPPTDKAASHGAPTHAEQESPLLYARLNDEGTAFEDQRNLMLKSRSLDGGGAIAADALGNVYAIWHGNEKNGKDGEPHRKVWIAHSSDDGKSFLAERIVPGAEDGACACCGLSAFVAKDGALFMLYRSASEVVNRDIHLLVSTDGGLHAKDTKVHEWNASQCVMSTAAFCQADAGVVTAWETKERVYFGVIDPVTHQLSKPMAPANQGSNCKHPAVAVNRTGQTILAWTQATSWAKGGEVAWQVFEKDGTPMLPENGKAKDLPVWGLAAAFARPDGGFLVVY